MMMFLFLIINNTIMVGIKCNDYGFNCSYSTDGKIEKVVYDFQKHMDYEHGIDYSQGTICESIKRKRY